MKYLLQLDLARLSLHDDTEEDSSTPAVATEPLSPVVMLRFVVVW